MDRSTHRPSHLLRLVVIFLASLSVNSYAQEVVIDLKEIKTLIDKWTEGHNSKNLPALTRLYTDEVIFYAKELPKVTCIGIKSKRLQSGLYFHQEIISEPSFIAYSSGFIKASFVKRITSGSKTRDYDAYLLVKKVDDQYLIAGESDLIADGNAGFSPNLGEELKQSRLKAPTKENLIKAKKTENLNQIFLIVLAISLVSAIGYLAYRKYNKKYMGSNVLPQTIDSKQATKPEKDGRAFEEFIIHRFNRKYFSMEEWRSDKITKGIYAKSSQYPDLQVQFKFGDVERIFAIECKFRRALANGEFKLEKRQFDKYKEFKQKKQIPVYVALGLGGTPENPQELFIIPLGSFDADGSIAYQSILNYYNNPSVNFFYDTQKDGLQYHRKSNDYM
ncbi:MAG TPA: hypothetical protein PLX35_11540 [Cyclobacteriaceae bacterium]|nr:hypothetical protein [Cyclobacteriaceae bacterium]